MLAHSTLLLLTLALTAQDAVHAGRIIGGKEATPHSRPYMTVVERHMSNGRITYCGGFLLREDFVMTAAHCTGRSMSIVILGVHNREQLVNTQKISVKKTFPNEGYDNDTYRNDILLLKLNLKAELTSSVSPIALAGPEDGEPQMCSVAGWGRSENSGKNLTDVLMEVNVTLGPCEFENGDTYFYCSTGRDGIGRGDSGGPLVCGNQVYGLVSAKIEHFDIHLFARIQNHSEWIKKIMNDV
uniref:trypsin n=1 Tax=Periophthalmus magnuspinnatus TaxID=409849 RepID=A0A3B4AMB8_9GOBI